LSIHVQLERFEGPLGLLLHLIREQQMDIFNINIHQITNQYLEYIKAMRQLDLEVAGEFVAMAATLLHIKSRMLLPSYNEDGEEVTEDPRKELVQKLIEYQKIKELSVELYKRPLLGRDVFVRGERTEVESLEEGELILEENPLFSLISAYRFAVRNMKKTVHRVFGELQSISARIMEMKEQFVVGQRLLFRDLVVVNGPDSTPARRSNQVLVTFLSLLELAKMGFISVFQNEPLSDIYIDPKRSIDRDIVSQVENYEGVDAERKAEALFAEAEEEAHHEVSENVAAAAIMGEEEGSEGQLSLDESTHSVMDETGEAPIVQEAVSDSASDDDIEAELARIEAEDEQRRQEANGEEPPREPDPEVQV
jgi:segregation and condensation protein A